MQWCVTLYKDKEELGHRTIDVEIVDTGKMYDRIHKLYDKYADRKPDFIDMRLCAGDERIGAGITLVDITGKETGWPNAEYDVKKAELAIYKYLAMVFVRRASAKQTETPEAPLESQTDPQAPQSTLP